MSLMSNYLDTMIQRFLSINQPVMPPVLLSLPPPAHCGPRNHKIVRSRYMPHQGKQEIARRRRQIDLGQLTGVGLPT